MDRRPALGRRPNGLEPETDIAMKAKLEQRSFLLLLVIVTLTFLYVLLPFFRLHFLGYGDHRPVLPVQSRLRQRFNHRENLAALVTLIIGILIAVVPLVLSASPLSRKGLPSIKSCRVGRLTLARCLTTRKRLARRSALHDRFGINYAHLKAQAVNGVMTSGQFLAQHAFNIGQNAFQFILNLSLMLYLAFFFLRDGQRLVFMLIQALPLGDERERFLFAKFAEVTRATVKGNLVVAIVQGALGGVGFWFLGIPAAFLWSVMMAIASLIPALGAALIWAPVALYMMLTGDLVHGIILAVYGVGVIGLVDNILRPILVGRDTKLPDYVVLLSTLGGLALFGIDGFVVGPLIAALFTAFWGIFMREFNDVHG